MIDQVRWGVLGVAKIAVEKVVPAMQRGEWSEVTAIASRDLAKARGAAKALGIARAFGSYEELLADPEIEAIYNPLPNHLHVPWSIRAAEAGKHVLCEKPIGLTVKEALSLLETRDRTGVLIQEAFMVRTHPQWVTTLDFVRAGRIGAIRSVTAYFSYYNRDPKNIRNSLEYGGGALMDIGCYLVFTSRLIFQEEPRRVSALITRDPEFGVDVLTSAILDFPSGQSILTCGTQVAPSQRVHVFGTQGRIEIEIPFNAPPDRACRIFLDDGSNHPGGRVQTLEFDACDQYTIQGDLFSRAIRENTELAVPLEDSVRNMAVIESLFRSAETGEWETPSIARAK
jgi:predicted dehydrogenase